jgi:hypothetical protein
MRDSPIIISISRTKPVKASQRDMPFSGYLYHFAYELESRRLRSNYFAVGHAAALLYIST